MDPNDVSEAPTGEKQRCPNRFPKRKDQNILQGTLLERALGGLERGDGPSKENVKWAAQNWVNAYSKRMHLASMRLKLLLRETCRDKGRRNLDVPKVLNIFDKPFLRQLVLDVNEKDKPFADKIVFRNKHPDLCAVVDACKRCAG